jgi:hypothetical protein
MGTNYTHLEIEERCRLRGLLEMGLGIGEIARRLGRHRITIHRERSSASTASKATGRTEPSAARGRASPHSFAVQFWAPIAHIFLRGISILWVVKNTPNGYDASACEERGAEYKAIGQVHFMASADHQDVSGS